MIASLYEEMLSKKSVIRTLSEFSAERGKEIGYDNVFDYSLGNPSVPTPQAFTDILIRLLQTETPTKLHGYSPTLGIPSVKQAVAASLHRRFGIPYQATDIFLTTGAAGAVAHALRCITVPGDEVITFAPYFPEYTAYVNLSGAVLKVVPADTAHFQIDFTELEKVISPKTMAVLINTPNNPSGAVYTTDTLQKLADFLAAKEAEYGHEIYLISDEPYREIVFDGKASPNPSTFYNRSIMCYSFSKSLSIPGERIGYIAFHPAIEKSATLTAMCGQISRGIGHNCPATIMQLAIAEALDLTSDFSVYEKNANLLYQELKDLGFAVQKPDGTFYIFPKALEADANLFSQKALKYDLVVVPSDSFGLPGYFRMAYCIPTEKVERSLEALRKFVKTEYQ
ncbi:pyridoxal phosphate-dependent aminotransferase [Clostridiales bacterium COT073_COT-073]|nr:pyridoxal phosphate-dependent aminotransferase [Clostridiales bacterium COT073_COT-073]